MDHVRFPVIEAVKQAQGSYADGAASVDITSDNHSV